MPEWTYEIWFDDECIDKGFGYETESVAKAFAENEIAEMMLLDDDWENAKREDFEIKTYQEWDDFEDWIE